MRYCLSQTHFRLFFEEVRFACLPKVVAAKVQATKLPALVSSAQEPLTGLGVEHAVAASPHFSLWNVPLGCDEAVI